MSPVPQRPAAWLVSVEDAVAALTWSPDARHAAALGVGGRLWWLDAVAGRVTGETAAHAGGAFRVAWHPREALVATCGQDGTVKLWPPLAGEPVQSFAAGAAWAEHLAWSPAGDWLAVTAGRTLTLWQPARGVVHVLQDHKATLTGVCWRADGQAVAVSSYGLVAIYDAASGQALERLTWKTSLISLAWSPDRRWVVAGTQEQSVQIWELPYRPDSELAMSGYTAKVREFAWHHTGKYLATGGGEQPMIWDCAGPGPAGTTPRILTGHTAKVATLAYQRRGHVLASGGQDGSVFFWNAGKSSQPLRETRLGAPVTAAAWAPDDSALLAGTHAGSLARLDKPAL
jgi:WD40 repeat protein